MHQIAQELPEYQHSFSPFYCDGILDQFRKWGLIEYAILGNKMVKRCMSYLQVNDLEIDFQGKQNEYDLVVTCTDQIVQKNIRNKNVVLVQEGMTDPETLLFHLVKRFRFLPRWFASTSTTGLSDAYDYFCVASEGYKDLFIRKGVKPEKIVVTGIPNFDNCSRYCKNDFPHKNFVLVCTSDMRETFKYENRKKFILNVVRIANGRQLIFKLHPNERIERATREINKYAPDALVYANGNTEEMIANCDILITSYSSTVYVGLALGKGVYSEFDVNELRKLTPLQNGTAARNIARVCRQLLEDETKKTRGAYDIPTLSFTRRRRKAYAKYVSALFSRSGS